MNYIVAICFVCLVAITVYLLVKLICSSSKDRIEFLKTFKKGKCAVIYFVAIPLYFVAFRYGGNTVLSSIFESITSSIGLVVLKYDYETVAALVQTNIFYSVTVHYCFVLVAVNACVFAFTLFGQNIVNHIRGRFALKHAKKLYLVVDCQAQNLTIAKSVSPKEGKVMFLASPDSKQRDSIFAQRNCWKKFRSTSDIGEILSKLHFENRQITVIINTDSDESNLIHVRQIVAFLESANTRANSRQKKECLHVFVFGEAVNISTFTYFEEKSKGTIRYINKYRLIALDFAERYPLTRFMTDELDTEHAVLKPDVDVNVAFVGFGKTNQKLFLTLVENTQFLTRDNGKLKAKDVSYWVYDKEDSKQNKNLNHGFFRYGSLYSEFEQNADEFLPLPPFPADIDTGESHFIKKDINACDFYTDIMRKINPKEGRRSFNYIVIAFGTDLENLDFAAKLVEKLQEWELDGFTKVFVKIRNGKLTRDVIRLELGRTEDFHIFGNEDTVVYRMDRIIRERISELAMSRHFCYMAENYVDGKNEEEVKEKAVDKWYGDWNQVQRESNMFACLSLRFKLHLLGYDYLPAECGEKDASQEFFAKYECGDSIRYTDRTVQGRRVVDYGDCIFDESTLRALFAMQEHQRWNAYMICNGYIPATISEIITYSKTELMRTRKHGNLTTFDGLKKYRDLMAERRGVPKCETDVIKYDYQIMDDAVWLLHRNGYIIVPKTVADKRLGG